MGTIKIELDIPEFKDSLDINVSLVKDNSGVVKLSTKSTPTSAIEKSSEPSVTITSDTPVVEKISTIEEKKTTKKKSSGNMMNIDF